MDDTTSAVRWRGTALALGITCVAAAYAPLLVSFAPAMARAADRSSAAPAALFAAMMWGGFVGTIAGGAWCSRRPPLAVIGVCLPLAALAQAAMAASALARDWAALVATQALISALVACAYLAGQTLLSQLHPRRPRRLLSLQLALLPAVGILVPLVAGSAATRLDPMAAPQAFAVGLGAAALGCIALAGLRWSVGAIPTTPPPTAAPRARALDLVGIGILAALHVGGDTAMYLWAPSLLASLPGPAPLPPAWVLSGIAVAYLVGRVGMAAAPEGLWERRLLLLPGMAAATLLVIALGGSCGFAATFALLVAASSCYGLEYPALVGFLARRDPAAFPAALSACNLGGAIGGALMTSQVGLANASVGVASALLVAPACFIAFCLLAWRLTRSGVPLLA